MPQGAPILVKEVQTPQRYDHGFGVLVVSSAAVFMALLGSTMVLRARADCALARPVVAPAVAPEVVVTAPPPQREACGEPTFHDAPDGTLRIVYTVCPTPARASAPVITTAPDATRLPAELVLR